MAAKDLPLGTLAKLCRMPQSTVSQILNGHWNDEKRLKKLAAQIERFPGPSVTVVA